MTYKMARRQIPAYKTTHTVVTVEAMKERGVWRYSSTSRPFYIRGNTRRYLLDRSIGGSHSRSGRFGENKSHAPVRKTNTILCRPARSHHTDWATPGIYFPSYFVNYSRHKYFIESWKSRPESSALWHHVMSYVVTNQTARRHNHEHHKLMFAAVKSSNITKL